VNSPGDFTPVEPEYAELHDGVPSLGSLLDRLGLWLAPDHAQVIAHPGLEAGQ
jgi:hypothetical protein